MFVIVSVTQKESTFNIYVFEQMETKYSKMDYVNFLKAVFHKIYLVHSWILCLK